MLWNASGGDNANKRRPKLRPLPSILVAGGHLLLCFAPITIISFFWLAHDTKVCQRGRRAMRALINCLRRLVVATRAREENTVACNIASLSVIPSVISNFSGGVPCVRFCLLRYARSIVTRNLYLVFDCYNCFPCFLSSGIRGRNAPGLLFAVCHVLAIRHPATRRSPCRKESLLPGCGKTSHVLHLVLYVAIRRSTG